MTIRPLNLEECEQYLKLISFFNNDHDEYLTVEEGRKIITAMKKQNNEIYVLAAEDGNLFACGSLLIEQKMIHSGSKVGHIEDVVVLEEYRERGFGKLLVRWLVQKAKDSGCYKAILNCSENNVGFYVSCGLQQKSIQMSRYFG